jgi:hypothetical protein
LKLKSEYATKKQLDRNWIAKEVELRVGTGVGGKILDSLDSLYSSTVQIVVVGVPPKPENGK